MVRSKITLPMKKAAALSIAAGIVIAGCGGTGGSVSPTSVKPTPSLSISPTPSPSPSPPLDLEALAAYEECNDQIGDFLDGLQELDSRLDIGLPFAAYNEQVGDVKVAYDRVPFGELSLACVLAAVPAEAALNKYAEASNIWNDCITDFDCSTDSSAFTSKLQTRWATAHDKIELALDNLEEIKETGPTPSP